MTKTKRGKVKKTGGKREGAGRQSKYPGKTIKRTILMTSLCRSLIIQEQARLIADDGAERSFSDAVESLARRATGTPDDK